MHKSLIALAVAGLVSAPVLAQSNVTIYGVLQESYIHKTNDQKGAEQKDYSDNLLGFRGEEDLGGGLKAFFVLEEKFGIDTGTSQNSSLRFTETSMIGIKSDSLGQLVLGRAPTVLDSIYSLTRAEAFENSGVGAFCPASGCRRGAYTSRYNNLARYTSPAFGGMSLIAHYALPEATTGGSGPTAQAKTPYGFALSGTWGPAFAEAGWQKDTTALNGVATGKHYKTWLVDGGYDFGAAKILGGYARSKGYDDFVQSNSQAKDVRYQIGTIVPVGGAGTLRANVGRWTSTNASGVKANPLTHVGLGYWHALSKRTTLMSAVSYDRQVDAYKDKADHQVGIQLGMRHMF